MIWKLDRLGRTLKNLVELVQKLIEKNIGLCSINDMAAAIPNSGLLIQPWVSHFSFLQDPKQFNSDLLHFLEQKPTW